MCSSDLLAQVEQALRGLQRGELGTRLPALAGREAALMSQAFNDMAQAIQDNLHARDEARAAQASLAHNREFTQVILQRVEAERARIARDLHDELGQQLTAARTVARLLAQDAHLTQHKAPLVDLLDRATAAMQDHLQTMLPRLRPLALDRLGLHDALQDLVQDWRRLAPQTRFSLDTSRLPAQLGDSVATAVYRIAQEDVTNAMRHAQPTHIALELAVRPTGLCVIVSDDGPGLPQAWQRPGHHGLSGICERAQALGGRVDFLPTHEGDTTRPGLTLLVTLPWGTHA